MPKRSAREITSSAVDSILNQISRKINRYLIAQSDQDTVGMLLNQLTPEEQEFLQRQQKIEIKGDKTDAEIEQLKNVDTAKLDELFKEMLDEDNRTN